MAKTTTTQKEPVRLREKKLSNGNVSLYLDICRNGRRHKEYLKLYLIDAKTPLEREQNRQTLATAQAVKSKRLIEIQNGEYTFTRQFKENTPFLEYYRKMVEERRKNPESQGNWGNWRSCLRYLEIYCDEKTTFREVTPEFITGFKEFLNNVEKDTHKRVGPRRERDTFQGLSQNSKVSYFNKLRACINQAYDDQIIPVNPLRGIEGFKEEEVKRDYLTLDEVKKLAATPCRYPVLKRAFLFSCLTGLRKSDIQKLTWGEVQKFGKYTRIVFKQRKTKGQEYLRHFFAGGEISRRKRQSGRHRIYGVYLRIMDFSGTATLEPGGGRQQKLDFPLRPAHVCRADARPGRRHLYRIEIARAPVPDDDANIRQGAGQEQTERRVAHSRHRITQKTYDKTGSRHKNSEDYPHHRRVEIPVGCGRRG